MCKKLVEELSMIKLHSLLDQSIEVGEKLKIILEMWGRYDNLSKADKRILDRTIKEMAIE